MANVMKFKVKEFQWFEMQTKVRQIIQEIIGPIQKRILQNSSFINKLKFNQNEDQKKIQQIALMIANDPKVFETGVFLRVDHRFEEQSKLIQELSRQITEENKYVDEKFKILDVRMQESSEVLKNVSILRERISKEIEIQNDNINKLRVNIIGMIDDLNTDLRSVRKAQQQNLEACEREEHALNEKVRSIDISIANIQETLSIHREMHKDQKNKLDQYCHLLERHSEQIVDLQDSKSMTKKLNEVVKDMENQLHKAQFRIETITPLITQAQISDCLYTVLPKKMKKRIAIFQFKKYFDLNREVLHKKFREVQIRFKGIELLQEMQKKNTKEIVQLKRKKILSMGIDIDHLTYEQRQRHYNQVILEDGLEDDDQQVQVAAKIDEKEVLTIIGNYFSRFINEVNEKLEIELKHNKKYLYEVESQVRHELLSFGNQYDRIKKQCQTYHNDQLLENKAHKVANKELSIEISLVSAESQRIKDYQRLFYNFCSLINHLQIQDEIDKQNISLMGIQQHNSENMTNTKERNSIVSVQKQCFSCCGYPATTLSAFKMACLSYNPSTIQIDSKQYKREELLQFTTSLLQNIKKSIHEETYQKIPPQTSQFTIEQKQYSTFKQPILKVDTEQFEKQKKTINRFRKTKKYQRNIYSNKYSTMKKNSLHEDMANASSIFTEIRQKNMKFLQ